jgi:hypothetical protein
VFAAFLPLPQPEKNAFSGGLYKPGTEARFILQIGLVDAVGVQQGASAAACGPCELFDFDFWLSFGAYVPM